jgi:hypothetical protein
MPPIMLLLCIVGGGVLFLRYLIVLLWARYCPRGWQSLVFVGDNPLLVLGCEQGYMIAIFYSGDKGNK